MKSMGRIKTPIAVNMIRWQVGHSNIVTSAYMPQNHNEHLYKL